MEVDDLLRLVLDDPGVHVRQVHQLGEAHAQVSDLGIPRGQRIADGLLRGVNGAAHGAEGIAGNVAAAAGGGGGKSPPGTLHGSRLRDPGGARG